MKFGSLRGCGKRAARSGGPGFTERETGARPGAAPAESCRRLNADRCSGGEQMAAEAGRFRNPGAVFCGWDFWILRCAQDDSACFLWVALVAPQASGVRGAVKLRGERATYGKVRGGLL
jgi:hypothetical protein